MWTRGNKESGFKIEVFDIAGQLVASEYGFETHQEAERWAEMKQREILFPPSKTPEELETDIAVIDAMLAEIEANAGQ